MKPPTCRFCSAPLKDVFADLGSTPLANSYLTHAQLDQPEPVYPLKAWVCRSCLLVQLEAFATPGEIFSDYAYFSSTSPSWVEHARRYCEDMRQRFNLTARSQVIEIASNDGYLLRHFRDMGIPVLGVEPAANIARYAEEHGIPTLVEFFGVRTACRMAAFDQTADLLCGTNVLAHVPDLHDFVGGMWRVLRPGGTVTMEFPHLLNLIALRQFDTIYHEHFSYFSFAFVQRVFAQHGITLYDVEELPTHGGSIRIFGRRSGEAGRVSPRVNALLAKERAAGLGRLETYTEFAAEPPKVREQLMSFLVREVVTEDRTVAAYGAPAKGNTLLNYCDIGQDLIKFVVDDSPHKQGLFMPGSHIPILPSSALATHQPDYVLILPWNLQDYIMDHNPQVREWGGRWVVPIPEVKVLP